MTRRLFLAFLALFLSGELLAQQPAAQPGKVGVIGSGRIGSTIGGLWAKAGYEVLFSDRDAETAKRAAEAAGGKARAGSVVEAAAFGEAVLIAVPYGALPAVQKEVGDRLKGRVVIDPNNPIPSRDGELGAKAREKGAGVSTAALLPGARVVRTFNSWGYGLMAREANRPAPRMAMPVAADDAAAKKLGLRLVQDAGFDAVDAGTLADSKVYDLGSSLSQQVLTAEEMRKALRKP